MGSFKRELAREKKKVVHVILGNTVSGNFWHKWQIPLTHKFVCLHCPGYLPALCSGVYFMFL